MIQTTETDSFLSRWREHPVIDVRSPGEFRQGHFPGAVNIPLFTDPERADVGTRYMKSGQEEAIHRGLEIAVPKIPEYLNALTGVAAPAGCVFLHCWRGGMRSGRMAEVFSQAGYTVTLIAGGYKAIRQAIRKDLGRPATIRVLGGCTGSGKTGILRAMAHLGEQVIDLEGLALHRGSAFGALGMPDQPTNEQVENDLFGVWSALDFTRPIWMEDESRMIGKVTLPDPVFEQISRSPMVRIEVPLPVRIGTLVKEYASFDKTLLAASIERIAERLGGLRTREALTALEENRFSDVAVIVLAYYDKAYHFSMARRTCEIVHVVELDGRDARQDAQTIIELSRNI